MNKKNSELKKNFDNAVTAYVNALLYMWSDYDTEDPIFSPAYGYWIADDNAGLYCYEDCFTITLSDIIFCVENEVSYDKYMEWAGYCIQASAFGFDTPNLQHWVKGCKRVPQETFDRFDEMRENLESLIEVVKQNPNIKI